MSYKLKVMPTVVKFLSKQPYEQQIEILRAISNLLDNGDIKQLKEYENRYRLKVEDYRIIYDIDNIKLVVTILNIGDKSNRRNFKRKTT